MSKKILQVLQQGYRCNVEEQDDPAVWISHAMRGAGGDIDLLLEGSAVNYAVKAQDSSGLCFGDMKQEEPANLPRDINAFVSKGGRVYVVSDDCAERGLETTELLEDVERVGRGEIAELFERYDLVWNW